ncbi:MAG: putative transport system permease protein [Clostridiales bacterium]|nr:putative transport system permease protein [Clostridiales bacterium]
MMKIAQAFHLAVKSILSNRMRSILTMLGMIIGVSAVILIVGLMRGITKKIEGSFSDMGINSISVYVQKNGNREVTEKDMYQFYDDNKDIIKEMSPLVDGKMVAKNGTTKLTTSIKGVSETYDTIKSLTIEKGRFIDYADVLLRQNNCVIGTYVEDKLFGKGKGVGETIKINGESYKVVGRVKEISGGKKGSGDDCIYISYSKVLRMLKTTEIGGYEMMAENAAQSDIVVAKLEPWLYNKIGNRDYYYAFSMSSMIAQMNSVMSMLALALAGIAAISLLVAGI